MTAAATTTLTAWLGQQLDADEAAARAGQQHGGFQAVICARVLAQVAAHRAIVELHAVGQPWCEVGHWDTVRHGDEGYEVPCPTLRAVASIYADREGYDEAWRP